MVIMELQEFIEKISSPVIMALAGAIMRFVQKIQADIRELTISTKETNYKLSHAFETINDVRATLEEHDKRITNLEKEI